MRYYLTSELDALDMAKIYIMLCINLYRYRDGDSGIIGTASFLELMRQDMPNGATDAVGIDMSSEIKVKKMGQDMQITTKEFLDMSFEEVGVNITVDDIPTISKEEFYTF